MNHQQRAEIEARARLSRHPEIYYAGRHMVIKGDPVATIVLNRRLFDNISLIETLEQTPENLTTAIIVREQATYCTRF